MQQYVKLKRHIKDIHQKTGKDLEEAYSEAKNRYAGLSHQACNLCGKGVRHMKYHLVNIHKLVPRSDEYRMALGTNVERSRTVTQEKKRTIQERREDLSKIPVSVQAWIAYESRGGLTVDRKGMQRNMRLVMEILETHSLTIMDLIEYYTVETSYELLYKTLENRKYKYASIGVILGHLKRFIDWACTETNRPLCELTNREHNFYIKLCRKKGNVENMNRKAAEYVPTIDEMGPLIQYTKHRDIMDGLIDQPRETLYEYGADLVHATLAWPLIIRAGARTGVIKNLLTDEVVNAVKSSDGVVISVKTHKTSLQYGPYQIGIPAREHDALVNFINGRDWESKYVFSSRRGAPFSMANIQRFMRKLFLLYDLPRLRIATVRKFLTTQAHREGDDRIQEATASLLKHSMKTAKRDYKAMQRDHDALDTANRLSKMLREKLSEKGDCGNDIVNEDDGVALMDEDDIMQDNDAVTSTTINVPRIDDDDHHQQHRQYQEEGDVYDDNNDDVVNIALDNLDKYNKDDICDGNVQKIRDERFKPEHLELLKRVFKRNISKRQKVSKNVIKKKRELLEEIYTYPGYNPKTLTDKIYDSLRSQIRLRL